MRTLNWIPLEDRRKVHLGVFVHKALKHEGSAHAVGKLSELLPQHKYSTRQKDTRRLEGTQQKTALVEKSIFYRAKNAWNNIPPAVRNLKSTNAFKNKYQSMLIDSYKGDKF